MRRHRPSRSSGTGRMGSAMAERLAPPGVEVVLYNRTPDRATALAARIGATRGGDARPRRPRRPTS